MRFQFGARIHRVFENSYRERRPGNRLQVKGLHVVFDRCWKEAAEGREDIQYKEGKDFERQLDPLPAGSAYRLQRAAGNILEVLN
jgi:hypothetical protein